MKLIEYCNKITKLEKNKADNEKIGGRIMRPEYSLDQVEVKTFPQAYQEGIFLLCWKLERGSRLYATIKPYEPAFSYQNTFQSGARTQFHTHDYIELAYVVEGEFMQKIMGQDIQFKRGEICLIDKNCLHQDYLFDNNSTIIFIGLANEIFDEVMVDKIEEESILHFLRMALLKQKDVQQFLHFKPKNPEDGQMEGLLLSLLLELEQQDEASKYICKGLLMRILHYISSKYDFYLSNEQRRKMNWIVFMEVTNYIQENYTDITIKELVKKFHFNEDYYNRLLKEKAGMTYSEYVQNIRLTQADKLLRSSKLTVEEVANRVGYRNKGYFYKIFTERYGVTPSKYRKQG
ncbi:MAG TPA: AraC family transcriptional regulator [Clostridiales bacterium]|nr:AraC family transcriptional regulator [Clostridiales bacterium]